jgi:hypothetical protein
MDSNDFLTLKLELVDEVPTFKLAALLDSLEKIYFYNLWLDLAKESTSPGFFPEKYPTSDTEHMWIEGLEIGTPNWIKLRGMKNQILAVAAFVATISTGPQAVMDVLKASVEIEKTKVQISLMEEELKLKQQQYISNSLDIEKKAYELMEKGLISQEAYKHKKESIPVVKENLMIGSSLVKPASFDLE